MSVSPQTATTIWRQRYETLRQHVLEDRQVLGADPLGLLLFFRQGVAGWMRAWQEPTSSLALSCAPAPCCPATPLWQEQLTRLLAQITVQHLQPTAH